MVCTPVVRLDTVSGARAEVPSMLDAQWIVRLASSTSEAVA
jgi:hypothetical protein